jgi:uncharacterized protein YndB with AHSA1/START domain
MIKYSSEVTINAAPERIFRVLTDASKYDRWTNMQHSTAVGGHVMDHVGARLEADIDEGPLKDKMVFEVSAIDSNKRIAFKTISSGKVSWEAEYRLVPDGGSSTRLIQSGQISLKGPLGLLSPLMGGEVSKKELQEIQKLKHLLESGEI